MAGDAIGFEPRYWAFISYSHKDAAFGRRLHRRLESYFLPRRLVGRNTIQGTAPRRLVPIFRDREELPAASDLSAEVRAALAQSRSLVVVCSPDAAASRWVSREVELFRALHPDRPILAALRNGDPAQSFPRALLCTGPAGERREPLAADFRDGRDGEHLGLLKLVAGIAGLGLDELAQRDAQRNRQRVTAVTGAALATVLVTGLLTAAALEARKDAERQRGEAEGLVEFMLTDLRDRLKGVGRLDVMTAVNQRALHYYEDQNIASLPVDSLERRAAASCNAMGEDDESTGKISMRRWKQFDEAKGVTTGTLLADAPNDPERIYDHAQSEYWVAYLNWRGNHFDFARAGFERYAVLARRLIAMNPHNPDWQEEGGNAESNLGTLAMHDRDLPAEARIHFTRALAYFETAARGRRNDPDSKSQISDIRAWLADCDLALGDYDEARANREAQRQILKALLVQDPRNAEYGRELLGNSLGTARIDITQGRADDADRRLTATLAEAVRYSVSDPNDKSLMKEKIIIELFIAKAKLREPNYDHAHLHALLADCGTDLARADQTLKDFCAVLSARAVAGSSSTDEAALDYLRRNRTRMAKMRRSREWRIEFPND